MSTDPIPTPEQGPALSVQPWSALDIAKSWNYDREAKSVQRRVLHANFCAGVDQGRKPVLSRLSAALLSSDPFPLLRQLERDLGGKPPEGTEEP